jgi:hypothetical protein
MKMRRREHSHEASATGSGAFPNEAIRILILIAARQSSEVSAILKLSHQRRDLRDAL